MRLKLALHFRLCLLKHLEVCLALAQRRFNKSNSHEASFQYLSMESCVEEKQKHPRQRSIQVAERAKV